jgi:hypothetical protein
MPAKLARIAKEILKVVRSVSRPLFAVFVSFGILAMAP